MTISTPGNAVEVANSIVELHSNKVDEVNRSVLRRFDVVDWKQMLYFCCSCISMWKNQTSRRAISRKWCVEKQLTSVKNSIIWCQEIIEICHVINTKIEDEEEIRQLVSFYAISACLVVTTLALKMIETQLLTSTTTIYSDEISENEETMDYEQNNE